MQPEIRRRFSDRLLDEIRQRYRINGQLEPLDGYESFIYECEHDGAPAVLRVTHSLRRTADLIAGELDWIAHLASNGLRVCPGLPSSAGRLVEAVEDGQDGAFLATMFIKAPGAHVWETAPGPGFDYNYGAFLGRMQHLAKSYQPANAGWRRPEWDSPLNLQVEQNLPAKETRARELWRELLRKIQALPKDRESYGLIHQDAHCGNLFVDGSDIWMFDFDDIVYSWFVYDLAMAIFYTLMFDNQDTARKDRFLGDFFRGYYSQNHLDEGWLKTIPLFLKMREIDLYASILNDVGSDYNDDEWCRRYMQGRRESIENGIPFLDYDWESLAAGLLCGESV